MAAGAYSKRLTHGHAYRIKKGQIHIMESAWIFVIFVIVMSIVVFLWKILPNTKDTDEDKIQEDFCNNWSQKHKKNTYDDLSHKNDDYNKSDY